ncbi:MAG: ATP-grasp domain-containing protein, partial [bacterium]|nr:ATP-grasp domain-containing protein [bacterium]
IESWMPHAMASPELLAKAQHMAARVTESLQGAGIWGVEFFLTADDVYFSELSPRPHDTGMVTLANTLNLNEFELHARAVLGYPIPEITLQRSGASAVILATEASPNEPTYTGIESPLSDPCIEIRIFGKPSTRVHRRMGVALASGDTNTSIEELREKAMAAAASVQVIIL